MFFTRFGCGMRSRDIFGSSLAILPSEFNADVGTLHTNAVFCQKVAKRDRARDLKLGSAIAVCRFDPLFKRRKRGLDGCTVKPGLFRSCHCFARGRRKPFPRFVRLGLYVSLHLKQRHYPFCLFARDIQRLRQIAERPAQQAFRIAKKTQRRFSRNRRAYCRVRSRRGLDCKRRIFRSCSGSSGRAFGFRPFPVFWPWRAASRSSFRSVSLRWFWWSSFFRHGLPVEKSTGRIAWTPRRLRIATKTRKRKAIAKISATPCASFDPQTE